MELKEIVGSYIRENRKSKGWSQEELGLRAGVSVNHVSKLERGLASPKLETVVKLCTALHISLDYLAYKLISELDVSQDDYREMIANSIENEVKLRLRERVINAIDEPDTVLK